MARGQNRQLEGEIFAFLRDALPELSAGKVDCDEAPDFVVASARGRHGLEVTSLHGSEPGEGSVEVQRRAANYLFFRLLDDYVKDSGELCIVTIHLMNSIRGGKPRARQLAGEVIRLLEPALARPGVSVQWTRLQEDTELPSELQSLAIHWPPKLKRPAVHMSDEGFLISCDFETPLRETLAAKASKFESYLRRCDRCWLAVVLPHYFVAEDKGVPSPVLAANYETPFERVILVDIHARRFWCLRTCDDASNR